MEENNRDYIGHFDVEYLFNLVSKDPGRVNTPLDADGFNLVGLTLLYNRPDLYERLKNMPAWEMVDFNYKSHIGTSLFDLAARIKQYDIALEIDRMS